MLSSLKNISSLYVEWKFLLDILIRQCWVLSAERMSNLESQIPLSLSFTGSFIVVIDCCKIYHKAVCRCRVDGSEGVDWSERSLVIHARVCVCEWVKMKYQRSCLGGEAWVTNETWKFVLGSMKIFDNIQCCSMFDEKYLMLAHQIMGNLTKKNFLDRPHISAADRGCELTWWIFCSVSSMQKCENLWRMWNALDISENSSYFTLNTFYLSFGYDVIGVIDFWEF